MNETVYIKYSARSFLVFTAERNFPPMSEKRLLDWWSVNCDNDLEEYSSVVETAKRSPNITFILQEAVW